MNSFKKGENCEKVHFHPNPSGSRLGCLPDGNGQRLIWHNQCPNSAQRTVGKSCRSTVYQIYSLSGHGDYRPSTPYLPTQASQKIAPKPQLLARNPGGLCFFKKPL